MAWPNITTYTDGLGNSIIYGATAVDDATVGTVAWTNVGNATASDDIYATAALNNQTTHYAKVTNFSFSIPTNATIIGIVVGVEKKTNSAAGARTSSLKLVKRNVITGDDRLRPASDGNDWSTSESTHTFGNSTDMWGLSLTPDDVNSVDFGVAVSCTTTGNMTVSLDSVYLTVYYVSGYNSTPQVVQGEISLFGFPYKLALNQDGTQSGVNVTLATIPPPKVTTNPEFDEASDSIISTYSVNDLRGGMGMWKYRTPDEMNRYWTGQNINPLYMAAITLAPLTTSLGSNPTGAVTTFYPITVNEFLGTFTTSWFDRKIYTWSIAGGYSAAVATLTTNAAADTCIFNGRIFYATRVGYEYQTTAAGALTTVASGASDPAAISFAVFDGKIWALDTNLKMWQSTSGSATSWTAGATLPLPTGSSTVAQLEVYVDTAHNPGLWALTNYGAFMYDETNGLWFESKVKFPKWSSLIGYARLAGATHQNSIMLRDNYRHLLKITNSYFGEEVDMVSPDDPDGPATDMGFTINRIVSDGRLMYATMGDQSSVASQAVSNTVGGLLVYNGTGFHPLYIDTVGSNNGGATALALVANNTDSNLLIFGEATSTFLLRYMKYNDLYLNPVHSTTNTYAAAGQIELPVYDGFYPSEDKTGLRVRVKLLGASSTETVQVAYRVNESTGAYTNLGSAITSNNEVIIPMGTNNVGLDFKSIQFKLTFARGATTTLAPKLVYFTMEYVRKEKVKRAFTVRLQLSRPYKGRSRDTMIQHLWGHMKATTFGTFSYRDDASNLRSYLVKVIMPTGVEKTGTNYGSEYSVQLVEMGEN